MKSLLAAALLSFSLGAASAPLTISIPGGPTGEPSSMMPQVATELAKRGWEVDLKFVGNCGPVLEELKSNKLVVTNWGSTMLVPSHTCYVELTDQNFVDIVVNNYLYLCGPRDQLDFKIEPGKKYKVAVNQYNSKDALDTVQRLGKELGIDIQFVVYKNSAGIRTGYEAKEVDMIFSSIGLIEHRNKRTTCFYTNAEEPIDGIPTIREKLNLTKPGEVFIMSTITNGAGLSQEQLSKLKSDIRDVLNMDFVREHQEKKAVQRYVAEPEKQLEFIRARVNNSK